jgi:hypothetical protein
LSEEQEIDRCATAGGAVMARRPAKAERKIRIVQYRDIETRDVVASFL